jgi:hypothetical protein
MECRTGGGAVVIMVSRAIEARRQKRRSGGRKVGQDLLGVVRKKGNEEEMLDIQKREQSGGSKSETPIEKKAAIETMERTAKDLCIVHKKGQDWISMRSVRI